MNGTWKLATSSFSSSLFVATDIPDCGAVAGVVPKLKNLNTPFTAADRVFTVTG